MKKVFSYIEQYQMIKPDDRVIVGLSGGADSVGLLLLLKEYQTECQKKSPEKNSFLLEAVHVNHQIRGEEANRDETFAKDLCESLGVSCSCYSSLVYSSSINLIGSILQVSHINCCVS